MSIIKLRNQESGLVSLIVAITFIVIISLITTSFALLSRREARQSLDRQLSTQAFYAAESGINDAVRAVKSGTTNITDCNGINTNSAFQPDLGDGLSYTCVLVTENPTSLEFGPIETNSPEIVRVQAPSTIGRLRISWQDYAGNQTFAPAGTPLLPQTGTVNSYADDTGLLRTTIIPVTNNLNRTDLINNSQNLFMYPGTAGSPGDFGSYSYVSGQTSQGAFVDGKCHTGNIPPTFPLYCNVDVEGLSALGTNVFYVRLQGVYRTSKVTIQAYTAGSGNNDPLKLSNGQTIIDATGKANDVLRRIQVRVPVTTKYVTPPGAFVSADNICKLLSITPTRTIDGCEPY